MRPSLLGMVRTELMRTLSNHPRSQLHNIYLHNNKVVLECLNRHHKCIKVMALAYKGYRRNSNKLLLIKIIWLINNEEVICLHKLACHNRRHINHNTIAKSQYTRRVK